MIDNKSEETKAKLTTTNETKHVVDDDDDDDTRSTEMTIWQDDGIYTWHNI